MCFHSEHIRESSLKNSAFCIFFQLHTNAPGLTTKCVVSGRDMPWKLLWLTWGYYRILICVIAGKPC